MDQGKALAAIVDDVKGELVDVYVVTAEVAAIRFDVSGSQNGGVFVRPTITVNRFGPDGLVDWSAIFAPEQIDEAFEVVDELTEGTARSASGPTPTATTD